MFNETNNSLIIDINKNKGDDNDKTLSIHDENIVLNLIVKNYRNSLYNRVIFKYI